MAVMVVVPFGVTRGSVARARSEPLGPQQGVGQIKQQADRNEAGERIIEYHGRSPSLEPFAGVGVAYAQYEEPEAEGQHDDVPHDKCSLSRLFACATSVVLGKATCDGSISPSNSDPGLTRISDGEVPLGA